MIQIYKYEELGQADYGWLKARHHFSFANYYNPDRMGFGVLRVINDDRVAAGYGFDPHPHRDMEIITYVRKGGITHEDSKGNKGRTGAGDVQVMSAGTGITHSEYNLDDEETNLYQIWIEPNKKGVEPRWDAYEFPKEPVDSQLNLLVSGDGQAPLHIHQDVYIYAGRLKKGSVIEHSVRENAYVLVSQGAVSLNGTPLGKGDGAEITGEEGVKIEAQTDSEVLVIDVPVS